MDGKLGAWAQEGESLLLGYEFRLSVRLGKALDANDGLDAFSRLCVDVRTDELHGQFGFWQGPPPYRLWIWKKDREAAYEWARRLRPSSRRKAAKRDGILYGILRLDCQERVLCQAHFGK
jgi:hypothetical protein